MFYLSRHSSYPSGLPAADRSICHNPSVYQAIIATQGGLSSLYIYFSPHIYTYMCSQNQRVFAYGNFAKNDEQTQERISAVLLRGDKNNRLYIPQT